MAKNINDVTTQEWTRGEWTVETWVHSTERPLTVNVLQPTVADLESNKWHHIAVSKSPNAATTYINGEKVLDEYTLEYEIAEHFNTKFYVVKPRGMLGNKDFGWDDMLEWCIKTFGPSQGVWDSSKERWYCNNARFYFRNKKDRDWFVVRFS